jgi:23S rRNA pseudouridine2605 synthase
MAYDKKPNPKGSYFENTFKPAPKERRISNKELDKLPSQRELENKDKPNAADDEFKAKREDFKRIAQDRKFGNSDGGDRRPSYNDRNRDDRKPYGDGAERRPYNNDRREGGDRGGYNADRNREDRKPFGDRPERKPYNNDRKEGGDRGGYNADRNRDDRKPFGDRAERKPFGDRPERKPYNNDRREGGDRGGYNADRNRDDRKPFGDRAERKPYNNDRREGGDRGGYNTDRNREDRKPFGDRAERKPFNNDRKEGGDLGGYNADRNRDDRKPFGDRAERKPFNNDRREGGDRGGYNADRNRDDRKPFGDRAERKPFNNDRREGGDRGGYNADRNRDDRKPFGDRAERKPFNNDRREGGDRGGYNADRNRDDRKPFGDRDRSSNTGFSRNNFNSRDTGGSSTFYDKKKEEWKKKDDAARKEYSERGGYKGRPENKIDGYNLDAPKPKKHDTPFVNARGDMYQDDAIEFANNKRMQVVEEIELRENEQMPLNKYIAHCGICSRREAADVVKSGRVCVNDLEQMNPAYKVLETDVITLDGKPIVPQEQQIYVLLNKPKDFITTSDDPEGRKTVMDLVANACDERIYPVGRLDRNTSGLLLLTNDGDLANKLSHPKYAVKKLYQVGLDMPLTKEHYNEIKEGLELEDGLAEVDELEYTDLADGTKIGIQIHSGRNRIVRRIFEHLGYEVQTLDRVIYANLTKKNLPRGSWRYLTPTEVKFLKHFNSNA